LEDPSVRSKIRNEVESQYGTVNLSLNSKQLVLPVESYLLLAACAEQDTESVLRKLNDQFNENEEVEGKIQKGKFKARIFKGVKDMSALLQSAMTIYQVGRPIIEAVVKIVS